MLDSVIELLAVKPHGVYFDGTLGGGGHTKAIFEANEGVKVFATDLDEFAIASAKQNLIDHADRLTVYHENFKSFKNLFETEEFNGLLFDGILLDLGVSSAQLDIRERGFSYLAEDERLNMKMDESQSLSAYEVVNIYKEEELERILRVYGEERFSKAIARNIALARQVKPIETCGELVKIIDRSIPYKFKREGHPAKKTFQAIRIEVNGELEGLDKALYDMADKLKSGGRLAVITFHSLEDRIVKTVFKDLTTGCTCDKRFPVCVCGRTQKCKEITRKPVTADEEELNVNSRAKSAKLRVVEKL